MTLRKEEDPNLETADPYSTAVLLLPIMLNYILACQGKYITTHHCIDGRQRQHLGAEFPSAFIR